jgi:hypothetical protein
VEGKDPGGTHLFNDSEMTSPSHNHQALDLPFIHSLPPSPILHLLRSQVQLFCTSRTWYNVQKGSCASSKIQN